MAESKTQADFREQVISGLSTLTEQQKGVIERLDKLNGSVARHEDRLSTIEKLAAGVAGGKTSNQIWMRYIWAAIGGILLFLGEHGGGFISAFLK
jgi:hypothetical protein